LVCAKRHRIAGSHIGFSTLRMEPCRMALGQAAGIAAAIAIDERLKVRNVPIDQLQERLLAQKATLIYYRDASCTDADFPLIQSMGLKGYLSDSAVSAAS
jgi:hypothetical protein